MKRVVTRDVLVTVAARWQLSWEGSVQEVEALKAVWSLLHTCRDGVPDLDIIWQHLTRAQALLPTAILQCANWLLSVDTTYIFRIQGSYLGFSHHLFLQWHLVGTFLCRWTMTDHTTAITE